MVTITYSHHGHNSIRIDNELILSSDDFRMKNDTWNYLMSCFYRYDSYRYDEHWCESCRDSDTEYIVYIPEEEAQRLISVHKRLDNVLANYYNILNHCG